MAEERALTAGVTVVVATFGDSKWAARATNAGYSASAQTTPPAEVIYSHHDSLHEARNAGADRARTEWLIFLDADDELDPRYIQAMLSGEGDLRQPATIGMYDDGHLDDVPVVIPAKASILDGNWMVIGTMVRKALFHQVGGFRPLVAWEDWDLWIRCVKAGATLGVVPDAIYRVAVHDGGRNDLDRFTASLLYSQIREDNQ